jgi:hypothetical protein
MVVCVGTFVAGAAAFLPRQTLWLDEATQLTGLGMGPVNVVRWLAGLDRPDVGQFPDRMPPLSYWIGWLWTLVFGLSEVSLRWLGLLCTAAATGLIYRAALKAFGTAPAWVAGLSFALAPPVLNLAVEIRAYPLLVLCSAAAFYFLIQIQTASTPRRRDVAGLALALAILTHYFGLLLAGATLVALAAVAAARRGPWKPVLVISGVVVLAALAISPFVRQSLLMNRGGNNGPDLEERVRSVRRLLPGLTAHPALAVFRPASTVAQTAAFALAALALVAAGPGRRSRFAVALVLGAGLSAVALGKVVLKAGDFDIARPIYNAWMWPGISLFLASGLATSHHAIRRAAMGCSLALLVCLGIGVVELRQHADHFAHGPVRTISRLIRTLGPSNIAVVHDAPPNQPVFLSCPLRYEFGLELPQYQAQPAADRASTRLRSYPGCRPGPADAGPTVALNRHYLVVVRSWATQPRDLLDQIRKGDRAGRAGSVVRELRASRCWRLVDRRVAVALDSADIALFERAENLRR